MSDFTLNSMPADFTKHSLTDQFIVQRASRQDLSEILAIYNQTIAGKQATAILTPVTYEERVEWFNAHLYSSTRPIYVVRSLSGDSNALSEGNNSNKHSDNSHDNDRQNTDPMESLPIIAWGSFSNLYARTAYHISTEISIYLHKDYHGKGLGSLLIRWMLTQAPNLGIHNIVALVFAHNQPSLGLFRKLGFEQWGYMPKVCDMQGFIADVVMLGRAITPEDIDKRI